MVKALAGFHIGDELLGVDQAIDYGDLDLRAVHIVGDLPDGFIAPDAGHAHLAQGIFGFIGQAVAHNGLRHAAGDAIDHRRTGAQTEGEVRGLQLQLVQMDACLPDHIHQLPGGEDQVYIRGAVVEEFVSGGLHFLGRAGHDGNVIGGAAVGGVLFCVLGLEDGGEHLHGRLAGGDIFQVLGVVQLQILHPGGAAGGEHGEGAACLQPLEEFLCLGDGGHVGGKVGVIYLVHAHDLQGGDHSIQDVLTGGVAKFLADGHPNGRSDLHHHPLLGVVNGLPGGADLIVNGDGAGGTHSGTLAAADALGLAELLVEGGHYLQLAAPAGKVQDALALFLLADPDAVAAEDALIGVTEDGVAGVVHLIAGAGIRKANMPHTEALGQLLQTAVAALGAVGAVAIVGGQEQLQDHAPVL